MTAHATPAAPASRPRADGPATPLLFTFLAGLLGIVALILVLAAGPTWALVGVTIGAILVFTVVVLVAANRLMDGDDGD